MQTRQHRGMHLHVPLLTAASRTRRPTDDVTAETYYYGHQSVFLGRRARSTFAHKIGCHGNVPCGIEKNNFRSFIYGQRSANSANYVKIGPDDAELLGFTKITKIFSKQQQRISPPLRAARAGAARITVHCAARRNSGSAAELRRERGARCHGSAHRRSV